MPKLRTAPAITLVETRRGVQICETTRRYDVLLHGVFFVQLYWNMRGYVGDLPTPSGGKLWMPEGSLASFKREIARLNKEFALLKADEDVSNSNNNPSRIKRLQSCSVLESSNRDGRPATA